MQNARIQDIRPAGSRALILLESYFIGCCNIERQPQQAHHVSGISYNSYRPSLAFSVLDLAVCDSFSESQTAYTRGKFAFAVCSDQSLTV